MVTEVRDSPVCREEMERERVGESEDRREKSYHNVYTCLERREKIVQRRRRDKRCPVEQISITGKGCGGAVVGDVMVKVLEESGCEREREE